MRNPVAVYESVARRLAETEAVRRNRRGSLLGPDGTVRAMTSGERIVVKLDPLRVGRLVADGTGRHYKGQVNSWLELSPTLVDASCERLVRESLELGDPDSTDAACTVEVTAPPAAVYRALTTQEGLAGWWTTRVQATDEVIRFWWSDADHTTMRVDRLVPEERVEWTCVEQHDRHLPSPAEWVGTRVVFEIAAIPGGTLLAVRHEGLLALDCGEVCSRGWLHFIADSLRPLVETGTGAPWSAA